MNGGMGCVSSTPSPHLDANEQPELASLRQFQSTASQEYNESWTFLDLCDADKKVSKKDKTIFWETVGSAFYGGSKECWEALDVALRKTEDIAFAREILNACGLKVCHKNALVCFDELGFLYTVPPFAAEKIGEEEEEEEEEDEEEASVPG